MWRTVELIENLGRLDHRMHDKVLLVDGVAGVFGGRNVGDEYFGLGARADMRDFDLLAAGAVLNELGSTFDAFWNGKWTVPLADLVDPAAMAERQREHRSARRTLSSLHADDPRLDARREMGRDEWLAALARARARMVRGTATVLHDAQDVLREGATRVVARGFEAALAGTRGDVLIVMAYLVPDDELLDDIRAHVAAGGRVRLLTNSYASTNQPLAHAFYAESRHTLLEAGAELYELRDDAWSHAHYRSPGSAATGLGLHAKSAVFGDAHVLVGSLNLDPRSMQLNTELGVLVESRELADWVRRCLEVDLAPRNAWRVTLAEDGSLRWSSQDVVLDAEPAMGGVEAVREWLLRALPLRGEV